jgi:ABC-type antimicrobial peptide transport system permease subunit
MNKVLLTILILMALGLIAYNVTIVDFNEPLQGDSLIALIGIVAALCAIILLLIYNTSRKIQKKLDEDR